MGRLGDVTPASASVVSHAPARRGYSAAERRQVVGMAVVVAVLLVVGWGGLLVIAAGGRVTAATGLGIGVGWTVFTLGMRHAFDADHIAAIDNTTRSLVGAGQRPLSVGFWFSLGHSTVVFVTCALLAVGVRAVAASVGDGGTGLRETFSTAGLAVSAVFLLVIGVTNLVALAGLVKAVRHGADEQGAERHLNNRGLVARLLSGRFSHIAKPWQIYPVGLLFGLGFDTATEVGLFVIAGGAATLALPWYAVLTLPVIFTAGMALFDTLDGLLMSYTYSWASANSARRRLTYNIVVTGLSVALALGIGAVEALSVVRDRLGLTTGVVGVVGGLNLDFLGYAAVAAFVCAAGLALLVTRAQPGAERSD